MKRFLLQITCPVSLLVTLAWATALAAPLTAEASSQALRDYVERPDDSFRYELRETQRINRSNLSTLLLTSQTWKGLEWRHRLSVIVPPEIHYPDTALLIVGGGSNENIDRRINPERTEARIAQLVAEHFGIAVAVVEHVPNQPIKGGLYEDELIAHTFAQFLATGDEDWPLLLPMVKSAVRAMDAISGFLDDQTGNGPSEFIVAGASKRGWTTWLTPVIDERVSAIVPMVFDILNFNPQIDHQRATFGSTSEMIDAYAEQDLFTQLQTREGAVLTRMVDPFAYRENLTLPKLVLLGTNDPYWTVDASSLYFPDLPDPAYLYYAPNAGHRLDMSITPSLLAFLGSIVTNEPLPEMHWEKEAEDTVSVKWDSDAGVNAEVWVWTAHSDSRDFRDAEWSATRIRDAEPGAATFELPTPPSGWTARYAEVRFERDEASPFHTCTTIFVRGAEGSPSE